MRANKKLFEQTSGSTVSCLFVFVVNGVCLSCLLNTIVNQHNPCALVVMPLFMLLAISPKPLSWQLLLFQIILVVQNKRQDLY
jgi:hypothetical protein